MMGPEGAANVVLTPLKLFVSFIGPLSGGLYAPGGPFCLLVNLSRSMKIPCKGTVLEQGSVGASWQGDDENTSAPGFICRRGGGRGLALEFASAEGKAVAHLNLARGIEANRERMQSWRKKRET